MMDGSKPMVFLVLLIVFMFLAAGCQTVTVGEPECPPGQVCLTEEQAEDLGIEIDKPTDEIPEGVTPVDLGDLMGDEPVTDEPGDQEMLETVDEEPVEPVIVPIRKDDVVTKTYFEGDFVSFPNLKATDPDGDEVEFSFTEPMDDNGEWQTEKGDAGKYRVTITASDGVNEVSKDVDIVILPVNAAPLMTNVDDLTVSEGDTVSFNPEVSDPEGDDVTISYDGWMTSSTKETDFDDAGEYEVIITASDGENDVVRTVKVTVLDTNRAPVIEDIDYPLEITEGDTITLEVKTEDADGDDIVISYGDPFDEYGSWVTSVGDAGDYEAEISVSDGKISVNRDVVFTVKPFNNPPVISGLSDLTVEEGSVIVLTPSVSDEDGDEVTISYDGWMTSSRYETTFDDAGVHDVSVTADDGIDSVTETITITVEDVNRPPVFEI